MEQVIAVGRRVREVRVSALWFESRMIKGFISLDESFEVVGGLPPGTALVDIRMDWSFHPPQVVLTFLSPNFDPVKEGEFVPQIDIVMENRECQSPSEKLKSESEK